MKKLKLINFFFHKAYLESFFLTFIITITLLFMTYAISVFRFYTYSETLLKNSNLDNSYVTARFGLDWDAFDTIEKNIEEMQKFPAIESILFARSASLQKNGKTLLFRLYSDKLHKAFPLKSEQGNWFNQTGLGEYNYIQCILGTPYLGRLKVGDIIQDDTLSYFSLNLVVTDIVEFPLYAANFNTSSTSMSADCFFRRSSFIVIKDTPDVISVLETAASETSANLKIDLDANFFIVFKENATETEKESALSYIKQYTGVQSYNEVMVNTRKNVEEITSRTMPIPLFLLIISTISYFSISVLLTYKKMREFSLFYLCGCSRKQVYGIIYMALSLLSMIAVAINITFIQSYRFICKKNGQWPLNTSIIDNKSILYLLLYALLLLTISFIVPIIVYNKETLNKRTVRYKHDYFKEHK